MRSASIGRCAGCFSGGLSIARYYHSAIRSVKRQFLAVFGRSGRLMGNRFSRIRPYRALLGRGLLLLDVNAGRGKILIGLSAEQVFG